MKFRKRTVAVIILFTLLGIVFAFGYSKIANTEESGVSKESIDILLKTNKAIAEIAATVKPSVVNISSTKTVRTQGVPFPFFNDPFFKRFFGDEFRFFERPREFKQSGLGSGVVVDKDGYILTNNHVIKGADEIKVKLSDKREYIGKIIGTDPKTDLAVIKIDSKDLPVIKLGDSDELKVGETVLAIGNPFGLSHTVTMGIVSAKERANVGIADYEDFIQTDAAINPGNSGGALVNIKGELIGINTAIFSTTGGYQGIGFAIPSNMAKVVMGSLIDKGKVIRGWLGVYIQLVTPELAEQFDLKDAEGALISDVIEDSPAEKAGIQRGDVIVEYNGKKVKDITSLRHMVANTPPDTEVNMKILRKGELKTLRVRIAESPGEETLRISKTFDNKLKGVYVQTLTPELKKTLDIPKRINGVLITDIEEGSPAEGILMRNDVIIEINRNPINNLKDYEAIVSEIESVQSVLLLIFRKDSVFYITL
jgi:serine protease Do